MNLLYDPSVALLGIYPIGLKTYFHPGIYKQVFTIALFVIKLENTFKQTVVHLYHRIQLSNSKEQIIDMWNNLDGPQENYTDRKSQSQEDILHDSTYVTCIK